MNVEPIECSVTKANVETRLEVTTVSVPLDIGSARTRRLVKV